MVAIASERAMAMSRPERRSHADRDRGMGPANTTERAEPAEHRDQDQQKHPRHRPGPSADPGTPGRPPRRITSHRTATAETATAGEAGPAAGRRGGSLHRTRHGVRQPIHGRREVVCVEPVAVAVPHVPVGVEGVAPGRGQFLEDLRPALGHAEHDRVGQVAREHVDALLELDLLGLRRAQVELEPLGLREHRRPIGGTAAEPVVERHHRQADDHAGRPDQSPAEEAEQEAQAGAHHDQRDPAGERQPADRGRVPREPPQFARDPRVQVVAGVGEHVGVFGLLQFVGGHAATRGEQVRQQSRLVAGELIASVQSGERPVLLAGLGDLQVSADGEVVDGRGDVGVVRGGVHQRPGSRTTPAVEPTAPASLLS